MSTYKAFAVASGDLFFQASSLDGICSEHSAAYGSHLNLDETGFAGRRDAHFVVFEVENDNEFDI